MSAINQPQLDMQVQAAQFRAINRRYSMIATVAIVMVLLLMALYTLMVTHALVTTSRFPLGWVVNWLPAIFYLWALWQLRGLFATLSKSVEGALARVVAVVGRVGWALTWGALVTLVPLVNFFINQPTRGGTIVVYLVPAMTLFLLGLALIVLAPILNRATELEAQAQSLQAQLDEFF